ncbi:division plane positioning ATPase MipZ [Pseudemcibacter aquimaris]|uniref:division plane positioning ATPase MipZ n=1 Tax=Pseudemcibacter aquimaris TaxID=2857064 RepID=UPI0020134057|nr:division plane positioning ATPase MipZ [Pseudemcibacter aquimaris]MCC3860474.1 division plane positioning ATPase MipZ [Pseudemcibacter aquimaris]WDU59299.1 division plane positioning ATPase MipZ [Pseudemcibacter aquimaris]
MPKDNNKAHVIVVGNEKGGSGKSTTAMHVIVSLLRKGFKISVIDLDSRQKSLARYLENRLKYSEKNELDLAIPDVYVLSRSLNGDVDNMMYEDTKNFSELMEELHEGSDFILIDCPGSDSNLSRLAHASADTLITPINDSFVDLDLLASVDQDTYKVDKLSLYSEMVWDARKHRAATDRGTIDWVVMRNRTSALDAKNKRRVNAALKELQKRISFRYIQGLGERVIYRELFPKGLTLVDLRDTKEKMTMSHVAARQELRRLMGDLDLPEWDEIEQNKQSKAS